MGPFLIAVFCVGVVAFFVWTFLQSSAEINERRLRWWQALSAELSVPLSEFTYEGNQRAIFPRGQGTLEMNCLLSMSHQNTQGGEDYMPFCITTYRGSGVPHWFKFDTLRERNTGVMGASKTHVTGLLHCNDVDLSDHIDLAFRMWFGGRNRDIKRLDTLRVSVDDTQAQFRERYSLSTPPEKVAEDVLVFAQGMESVAKRLPSSWMLALCQLLGELDDAALFRTIASKLVRRSHEEVHAHMRSLVKTARPHVLALWCAYGFFDLVRDAGLKRNKRQKIFEHWVTRASLSARALKTSQAGEVARFLCKDLQLKELRSSKLSSKPRMVLPLLMCLFERHPEQVWEASKEVMGLLEFDEAQLWLKHLKGSGFTLAPEHLAHLKVEDDMDASTSQEMLTHIRRVASSNPDALRGDAFNTQITHVLKHLSGDTMTLTCAWLKRVGTPSTLRMLNKHLADHFSSWSSQGKDVAQLIEQLAQRAGHAGGLSLSADDQAGGLSVSGEAKQGDVTFALDEAAQAASKKS